MRYSGQRICLIVVLAVLAVIMASPGAAQRLESKRLDILLARHGWIKIGLETSARRAEISVPSGAELSADGKAFECSAGVVRVGASREGVQVGIPGQGTLTVREMVIAPKGISFGLGGREYRGRARISSRGGSMLIINELMIEDWLKGVLPAEIGSDAPLEALKAQAVAGRSEAIFRLASPPHADSGYDFCAGPHCQAYKGTDAETEAIRRACDETLGFVLVAEGDVVNAVYHNVCGGATARAEDVWDGGPVAGISSVLDTARGGQPDLQSEAAAARFIASSGQEYFCYPENPGYANYAKKYFRWSKTMTAAEAGRAAGVGTLTDIQVMERRQSGRVRKLRVVGTGGTKVIEKELPIRNVFDLWSGLFVLQVERGGAGGAVQRVTFAGAGNGHGVGLCQHGAREIARRGGTFSQILGHYYPASALRKVYRP